MRSAILVFAFSFGLTATLVSQAPLGLIVSPVAGSGLSAESVTGTIWNGQLTGVRLGGITVPEARARLDPSGLLRGEVRTLVESRSSRAVVVRGLDLRGVERASLSADLSRLGFSLPSPGAVHLESVTLLFDKKGCRAAHGKVLTNLFQEGWSGPQLTGSLSCNGGEAIARLAGADRSSQAQVLMTLQRDGRYRLRSRIQTTDETLRAALALGGFRSSASGLERFDDGKLQPAV